MDDHHSYAPSRRVTKAVEKYRSGMDLGKFGRILRDLAKEGNLGLVYFRDEEIRSAIEIVCRR